MEAGWGYIKLTTILYHIGFKKKKNQSCAMFTETLFTTDKGGNNPNTHKWMNEILIYIATQRD